MTMNKNIFDEAGLKAKQYESGMDNYEIGSQKDKFCRYKIAMKRGLDPDATWDDINKQLAETTRKLTAAKLGLDLDASWKDIVNENKKKRLP